MGNDRLTEWALRHHKSICSITWILRIAVGFVFILSGFVKAIDPWGTLYKVDAYLSIISLDIWPNLELVGVFALCSIEFLTGILLLTGCLRQSISIVTLLFMTFMLPLTLWIAISDPVEDCGCFGDALIISNWATFWKNIVLSLATMWLVIFNKRCHWVITPALQWIAILTSLIFISVIEIYGYASQPLIDFRPYKLGETIIESEDNAGIHPEYVFIYEKDGVRKSFSENDVLPDESEGWTFINRVEKHINNTSAVVSRDSKNLRIYDRSGNIDMTDDVIETEGNELIIMIPALDKVSPATTWKLNSLYEWSVKNNVKMIGVVSGSTDEIATWEDLSMASYPIYTSDDTQIKEVVRGNPGIVYLEDGRIIWKSTLSAISIDDFLSPDTSEDAREFSTDNYIILKNCIYMYAIAMISLVILSFTPAIKNLIHGDKAHHEESSLPDKPVLRKTGVPSRE